MKKKEKTRVLIVDDHPIVRLGIVQIVNMEPDMTVCGEAESAEEAIPRIAEKNPDLITIDISLKGASGLDLIKTVKTRFPDLPMLVVSMHDESLYAERVLHAGAKGYVMKQEVPEKVTGAIRTIVGGGIYLTEKMKTRMLEKVAHSPSTESLSPVDVLSDRELEVFQLIGEGWGTRKISEKLNLSIKTIESYREHIKTKLNLSNASELVQHAIQWVQTGSLKV